MRRRGIDDLRGLGAKLIGKRNGLPRGIVRQTKHDEIDVAQHLRARLAILALRGVDAFHVDGIDAGQPLADLETRGACLAVYEDATNFRLCCRCRCHLSRQTQADA